MRRSDDVQRNVSSKLLRSWIGLSLLAALSSVQLACATTGATSSGTAAVPNTYSTTGVGAARYVTAPPKGAALRGPHAYRVGQGVERAAAAGVTLTGDPRLSELARLVLEHDRDHGVLPPGAAIDLWAHHLGLWEPPPAIALIKHHDPAVITDRIATDIAEATRGHRFTHYGAYTAESQGAVVAALVLTFRWADLAPVPRELRKGAVIKVRGELAADLDSPQVALVPPDGDVQRTPPQKGRRFVFELPTMEEGEYRVELLASSPLGPTVVANFPVYVGVRPRTEITAITDEASTSESAAAVQSKLFELINADRERIGRKPLVLMDELDAIALAHSVDMRDSGFVGHTSRNTGTAAERVQRAGVRVALVLENVGRGYSAEGVHRGLMDSPGHRQNILSADVSHVGIGVVEVIEGEGRAYLVTEVFTHLAERIDAEDARDQLIELLASKRAASGLKEARHDEVLSELCEAAAREFFASQAQERPLIEGLSRKAAASKLPYQRLGALMMVVTSIEQASQVSALLDPKAKGIGIGVAQGTRSDTVENAIAVVVLLGY
jgi:uncharacterized protein YkwD